MATPPAERWLRIAVETDHAQEEYVSNLLNDAAGGRGVEILDRRAALLAPEAAMLAPGRILVRAYVTFADYDSSRFDVSGVPGAILSPPHPIDEDWRQNWKKFFKAARVGRRFIVRPPWDDIDERLDGDIDIVIEPGMAFGTGTHETTRLCIAQLDAMRLTGQAVLDVGCGSGVLAVAAVKVGASSVRCLDIDDASIEATLDNAVRNDVGGRITASTTPLARINEQYDLVMANILASILAALRDDLYARVKPGGTLVLSGILGVEADEVADHFAELGLIRRALVHDREWVAIRFDRPE
ncbi:MAG: ribosomal protein L11 methyltransferase [Myxococcota bacterium]|jgi:ribosomal protein L11 methyltransferase